MAVRTGKGFTMLKVFIGYDPREVVAWHVLAHSILRRSSVPVEIIPLVRHQLRSVGFNREKDKKSSTDFSDTRFLVPFLCDFSGWAIFMDCDQLMLIDIVELWQQRDDKYAVMVRKHNHVPVEQTKFLGTEQTKYTKKNWSSLMLMNCSECSTLTPETVNRLSGLELHQFKWLAGDHLIGELDQGWNHLVGYDAPNPLAKHVHFTIGGPYYKEYSRCEFSSEWFSEYQQMTYAAQLDVPLVNTGR